MPLIPAFRRKRHADLCLQGQSIEQVPRHQSLGSEINHQKQETCEDVIEQENEVLGTTSSRT